MNGGMDSAAVVITGLGLVSPLGVGAATNWTAVAAGRTGIGPVAETSGTAWLGRVEGVTLPADLPPKLVSQSKFLNRSGVFGVVAAGEAVAQSGGLEDVPAARRSLYVGTGDLQPVGYEFLYPATRSATGGTFRDADPARFNQAAMEQVNPFFLLDSLANNPFSFLSALFGCMGSGTCLAAQSPAGNHALELAYRSVRAGRADVALAVGVGSWINPVIRHELAGLRLLSRGRRGAASFRPFDRRRDGFFTGEGAAALVLESAGRAARRGVRVLAVVEGVGNATEAAPGLPVLDSVTRRAMAAALSDAGCASADLGFICPHGSGTVKGDRAELRAIRDLLGGAAAGVPVAGLKPHTGHMGAASDLAEAALGVLALDAGSVPATPHFESGESEFAALRIAASPQPLAIPRFLTVSYGIGGQASGAVIALPGSLRRG
ncbi:MAG TPA: beta-ketoacyl synthase N-terminal-like domain-containing protein [Acidobacteriota bacterium]|nr:beta-ketoacyl synthase N-terminal-like domain-containing protein [Acidobacteriota bacterium]HQM62959.1 beta-ketoacyl synthase N-terminal-like domain-containing protein [Acidobacteriota bacterium]